MSYPAENFCTERPDWYQLPWAVRRHAVGNRLSRAVRRGAAGYLRNQLSRLARCWESIIARVIKASRTAGRSIIAHRVIKASRRRATGESIIERWPLARWGPGQSYRAGPKWFTGKTYRQAANCATGKRADWWRNGVITTTVVQLQFLLVAEMHAFACPAWAETPNITSPN